MLKYLYATVLSISLFTTKSIAQNWEPFPYSNAYFTPEGGYKHFYLPLYNVNQTDTFLGIGMRNAIDLYFEDNPVNETYINTDLITYLNTRSGITQHDVTRTTWIKTFKKVNNHIEFISERDDVFKVNTHGIDTFYLAFNEFNNIDTTYYISKIDSIEALATDSILHFGIYTLNDSQKVEGSTIILSKNDGIKQMPIFTFFPYCIPTYLEGTILDVYPYSQSRKYLINKHFLGDELQSIYEEGILGTFRTKIYTKKIYINQTYNQDSTAFINEVDIWTVKQTRTGFQEPFTQTTTYDSYTEQSVHFGPINAIPVIDGMLHYLDSNGAFVKRFVDDNGYIDYNNPTYYSDETLYPHLEKGYTRTHDVPEYFYELNKVIYQNTNGEISGYPMPSPFYLNINKSVNNQIRYTLNKQILNLLNPEHFKSARIYSIDGKFKTYLSTEELYHPILTSPYTSGIHMLILIHQDGHSSTIKF